MKLTIKQQEMLLALERDGKDAWRFGCWNISVIDALRRRGLIDNDGITDAGRVALREIEAD